MSELYTIGDLKRLGHLGDTEEEQDRKAWMIEEIQRLKKERNACIIAHNYMEPALFAVADVLGDSMKLALEGAKTDKPIIVCCTVHFMAEGAKIYAPDKLVLLPSLGAGCSLAASADDWDVEDRIDELREHFPDIKVVSYVNTTAAVKALSDVCCTSSSAVEIVQKLGARRVLFLPDQNLGGYVGNLLGYSVVSINPKADIREQVNLMRELERLKQLDGVLFAWGGNCHVHQDITPEQIKWYRVNMPEVVIFVHPECRKDVQELADAVLSTEQMVTRAKAHSGKQFLIVTECGLSDRLELEVPDKKFFRSCKLCQYMKSVTLENTLEALQKLQYPVEVPEKARLGAKRALDRMFELSGNTQVTKKDFS